MRPKQGDLILHFDNASLNLTEERQYAGRQKPTRLRPLREQEWRGRGEGREFV
jgi:hypothetical protein